jgi:hypothetical protein
MLRGNSGAVVNYRISSTVSSLLLNVFDAGVIRISVFII